MDLIGVIVAAAFVLMGIFCFVLVFVLSFLAFMGWKRPTSHRGDTTDGPNAGKDS